MMTYPGWVLVLEGAGMAGLKAAGRLKTGDKEALLRPGVVALAALPAIAAVATLAGFCSVMATMLLALLPGFLTHFSLQGQRGHCWRLCMLLGMLQAYSAGGFML
jgi:hypothetical protein